MAVFDTILGEQLSSVIFVQDYLQIDFDGNLFNFYAWPILKKGSYEMKFPNIEYRNFLCEFITKIVYEVYDVENVVFEIVFEDKSSLRLDLKEAMGEVLYFTLNNGGWGTIAI